MLRNLAGQLFSTMILVGLLVGWWMAAGRDVGIMGSQAYGLAMWAGSLFAPLIESLFGATATAAGIPAVEVI